ncbi:deaminase [Nostoc sp. KVJ3]|uniref:deaminase n=1 Tax=Nostoc sp. KVJ3 TaxID=457945 RepID=UPI00223785ED|nr:deaminase [Nostoc sp. KVJ3]
MPLKLHNFEWEGERLVQRETEPHHIAGVLASIRLTLENSDCDWEDIYSAYYECEEDGTITFYEGESAEAGNPGIWTYVVYSCPVGQEEVVKNPDINTLAPAQELRQLIYKFIFQELAEYRQQLGLTPAGSEDDRATIAKLELGDSVFFGISAGSNPNRRKITLKVNPISRTHAEADAFQQAFDAGLRGGRARLTVDRDLCRACGQNGGVKGMAKQLGLEEIEVISPSGRQTITLK